MASRFGRRDRQGFATLRKRPRPVRLAVTSECVARIPNRLLSAAHPLAAVPGSTTQPLFIVGTMLYAIQEGDEGSVKLGTTTDPITRLQSLQTSNCRDLHVRALWPGDGVDEKALHRRFAHVHLAREWFAFTPELHEFIRERAATAPPALQQLRAAAESRNRQGKRVAAKRPSRRKRPVPPPLPPQKPEHPTWSAHALLARDEVGSADDWIAVLCDIAPSLTTDHLLTYLELVAGADDRGRLQIELGRIGDRVIGERDHSRAAQLLDDLKTLVLPDADGPYRQLPSARLTSFLMVRISSPAPLGSDFLDALIARGSARVGLARYGAGFGRHA